MAFPWKIINVVINLFADHGAKALSRNVKFQRWVHLTNHRLFGTPLPKEEEYYQHYLKNKQRERESPNTHNFQNKNEKRETLVNIVADEAKQVLSDMLPGGKKLMGDKDGKQRGAPEKRP